VKRVLICVLLAAGCSAPPPPEPAVVPAPQSQRELGPGHVTATALNVREEPTADAPILTTVQRGATLQLLEEKDGWYRVRVASGGVGWVSAKYVAMGAPPPRRGRAGCPPDSDYAFEKSPLPSFSEDGRHGLVVIDANVNTSGVVTSTKVVSNNTGDASLAAIAEREIRAAKFVPPVRDCVKRSFVFTYKRAF
jgi:hypothetical protein